MSPLLATMARSYTRRAREYRRMAQAIMDSDPGKACELIGRAKGLERAASVLSTVNPEARA